MQCDVCRKICELTRIDENYVTLGKCRSCYSGYSKSRLNIDSIYSKFENLKKDHTDEQFRLLLRKGVYPYEYMDSWDRFEETSLPPKKAFHSKLNMSRISDSDYSHMQRVWKAFRMRNLGECHNLYFKTDVLLLANTFKAFRNTCLEQYALDPAHFYTSHGLAWQVCLKKTEIFISPDMLLMFEHGIRSRIIQAVH